LFQGWDPPFACFFFINWNLRGRVKLCFIYSNFNNFNSPTLLPFTINKFPIPTHCSTLHLRGKITKPPTTSKSLSTLSAAKIFLISLLYSLSLYCRKKDFVWGKYVFTQLPLNSGEARQCRSKADTNYILRGSFGMASFHWKSKCNLFILKI
jgi:hypothetical protein